VSLVDDVIADPGRWSFLAAVRVLSAAEPDRPGPGRSKRIDQDSVRFRQTPSLKMEPNEIFSVERQETPNGVVVEVSQVFFGPFGPHGALPLHVTEDAIEAIYLKEIGDPLGSSNLQDFTDLLTHRMTGLLYRAWEVGDVAASRSSGDDDYTVWLSALYGQGMVGFADRDVMPDDLKRFGAGWLGNARQPAAALAAIVRSVVGEPVEIIEFVPEWLEIPDNQQARLGQGQLGIDIVAGRRAFAIDTRLCIKTGSLDLERFRALLPTGQLHEMMRDAVRNSIGLALGWEIQLCLDVREVPSLSLGGETRLGWDTWLPDKMRPNETEDIRLEGTF